MPTTLFSQATKISSPSTFQPPLTTFAGGFTSDTIALHSTSREMPTTTPPLTTRSPPSARSPRNTSGPSKPLSAMPTGAPSTAVRGSSRRQRPRHAHLPLILDYPLPQERKVLEDSATRHCRASHRDWVCNHHTTTLLHSEPLVNEDCRDGVVTEQWRVYIDDEEWVWKPNGDGNDSEVTAVLRMGRIKGLLRKKDEEDGYEDCMRMEMNAR
ncbi:hypothetical protein DEO72_LG1g2681 [Vigna unguiculata]|uniref:Uncharacterized protein n=1 Tax=Vigna unguiculata TaxID=3917 RepID=A0A4D6KYQ8_VIGUN|nr:hypothetical protein DEO72_LG1g2681 [Vigna unguiculata]